MAKYISLVKYTAKGVENIKESPNRLDAVKQLCESMGAKVEGFYLTMGRYNHNESVKIRGQKNL